MTICIGAICCGSAGKAVVVAADRMVTMGGLTEFEHDVPKITPIGARMVTLVAGDALRGAELVRMVGSPPPDASVRDVAQALALNYAELRRRVAEATHLAPRGIGLAEFYQGGVQARLVPPIAAGLDQEIARLDLGIEVLVAGVDQDGGHVFNARNPGGLVDDLDRIGFHAVGSGALHAIQSLIGFGHAPSRSLNETVFRVFASKRRAEIAPGVGRATDLWVIEEDRVTELSQTAMRKLDALYAELEPVRAELDQKIEGFNIEEAGDGSAT